MAHIQQANRMMAGWATLSAAVSASVYTPTVIVTNQTELNTELAKSAAALEGQVIGVQYNATPYVINRTGTGSVSGKDFGVGGLVVTQSGVVMPVFSLIEIDDCNNLTLNSLEVYNNDGDNAGSLITAYDYVSNLLISRCVIHGKYYDPNGNYIASGSYTNRRAFSKSGAGASYLTNFTISSCTIYDINRGFSISAAGYLRVIGNTIYNTYSDAITLSYHPDNTETTVSWNEFSAAIGLASDVDNPHVDFIQLLDPGSAVSWNIQVIGNFMYIGNARGQANGCFCNLSTAGAYITGAIKGNVFLTNSLHGISIDQANALTVIGNTVLSGDVNGGGLNASIRVGADLSTGIHIIKNNVTHAYVLGGTPTNTNNNTAVRSTSAYSALFDGTSFAKTPDLDTKAEVMSAFSRKTGGALDQTIDIGALGSGYANFTARTLNEAME